MKIIKYSLVILFLFMLIGIVRCDKKQETKSIFPVTSLSQQTIAFFETALSNINESDCFFVSKEGDVYSLINSVEEFKAIYSCEDGLPEIDFMRYSLIIGKKRMPNSYYSVANQYIEESDVLILNIIAQLSSEGHWPAFSNMYYWGVYPKLPNKKVNINIMD